MQANVETVKEIKRVERDRKQLAKDLNRAQSK
jgi:hypothetical protein